MYIKLCKNTESVIEFYFDNLWQIAKLHENMKFLKFSRIRNIYIYNWVVNYRKRIKNIYCGMNTIEINVCKIISKILAAIQNKKRSCSRNMR